MPQPLLDAAYWNNKYENQLTGWDLGEVSPPIARFITSLSTKNQAILIPGCGYGHEAAAFLKAGFTNITVIDIASEAVRKLQQEHEGNERIRVIHGDFFGLTEVFDLIIEQTFFCALPPAKRPHYVQKMHELLQPGGRLQGVLFNTHFEFDGPPFGGSEEEYHTLFRNHFNNLSLQLCLNSAPKRAGMEFWFEAIKSTNP